VAARGRKLRRAPERLAVDLRTQKMLSLPLDEIATSSRPSSGIGDPKTMAELASQPTSIQSIYNWYRDERLFVNRKYQRKLVWTLEEKQKLVESIIKKYPIPAILLAEQADKPGSYEIIDGLQRLHAIVSFIETAFPTLDSRYFDVKHFPTAKAYLDENKFEDYSGGNCITPKEVSTILDYSLALSVMRNATEAEINDVFDRINTYGHRLSDQERRQAGVQNAFPRWSVK
jgi:uncharacterized protein with ParB-like and HNH nuclease domain